MADSLKLSEHEAADRYDQGIFQYPLKFRIEKKPEIIQPHPAGVPDGITNPEITEGYLYPHHGHIEKKKKANSTGQDHGILPAVLDDVRGNAVN
jgi:hypothetical protein